MAQDTEHKFHNPIMEFPGFNLRTAANAAMAKLAEIIGSFDLSITEASILVVVQANPACRQSQICKALNIVSANLTPILHRLEKRELIERTPLDGRTNSLNLTKEGKKAATSCLEAMKAFETTMATYIHPVTEQDFTGALKRLSAALTDQS